MARMLADGVVYHLPGRHLGGGRLEGRAAVFQRLAAAAAWCDVPFEIDVLASSRAGGFTTTIERLRARRGSDVLDQTVSVVWRFEDARCVEIWAHFADQVACDRFWCDFVAPGSIG